MDFAPGTRLGPYGLVSTPGAREMGEIRGAVPEADPTKGGEACLNSENSRKTSTSFYSRP